MYRLANLSTGEVIVCALVILILFGAGAIPKFARSLGAARREFDKGMRDGGEEPPKDQPADKKP